MKKYRIMFKKQNEPVDDIEEIRAENWDDANTQALHLSTQKEKRVVLIAELP